MNLVLVVFTKCFICTHFYIYIYIILFLLKSTFCILLNFVSLLALGSVFVFFCSSLIYLIFCSTSFFVFLFHILSLQFFASVFFTEYHSFTLSLCKGINLWCVLIRRNLVAVATLRLLLQVLLSSSGFVTGSRVVNSILQPNVECFGQFLNFPSLKEFSTTELS